MFHAVKERCSHCRNITKIVGRPYLRLNNHNRLLSSINLAVMIILLLGIIMIKIST